MQGDVLAKEIEMLRKALADTEQMRADADREVQALSELPKQMEQLQVGVPEG